MTFKMKFALRFQISKQKNFIKNLALHHFLKETQALLDSLRSEIENKDEYEYVNLVIARMRSCP